MAGLFDCCSGGVVSPIRLASKRYSDGASPVCVCTVPWFIIVIAALSFPPDFVSAVRRQRTVFRRTAARYYRYCYPSSSGKRSPVAVYYSLTVMIDGSSEQHLAFAPVKASRNELDGDRSKRTAKVQMEVFNTIASMSRPHLIPLWSAILRIRSQHRQDLHLQTRHHPFVVQSL
jgi:hypothetical protein